LQVHQVHNLEWCFDGRGPKLKAGQLTDEVDPFPCYAHPVGLVRKVADEVEAALTLPREVNIYNYHYEVLTRTNGYACEMEWCSEYTIVLSGKRIPPHPGMTRYLVAHEYGHHVDYFLSWMQGFSIHKEYQELRGGVTEYGARQWHNNVGELIANDFRILVAGQEMDFWPHTGFEHPHKRLDVQRWWAEAVHKIEEYTP
jgi:hypothetical protein